MTRSSNGLGLLVLRLALGAVFIAHGAQKLFGAWSGPGIDGTTDMFDGLGIPLPEVMAPFVGALEFGGGIFLILGLATPLVGLMLFGNMVVALLTVHAENGFFADSGGFEFVMMLGAGSLALALSGGGRFSLDAAVGLTDKLRAKLPMTRERRVPTPS